MPKTFRNNSHKNRRHTKKCKFQATTQALIKWYVSIYEKLGWMVLAKQKGLKFKLEYYKKSIQLLKEELICKINSVQDYDKRNDLRIILDNVIILERHVQKDFR
jgi:hypothetical protein